jgi:hypothetical protein
VERVSADNLSYKDFFYKYALTSTPVVITGLVNEMTTVPWTLEHIADIAGIFITFSFNPVNSEHRNKEMSYI